MDHADMDAFVERVEQSSDIVDVVSQYVTLKRKGNRFWGCCPFHQERTPSFSVVPDKGFFYCFGCHAGGNVFKFLSLIENVSYFEAIKLQAEKLGIPMPERHRSEAEKAREQRLKDLLKVNEMARTFFHNCLTMTHMGEVGKAYFAGRGISVETIDEFSLGYAPEAWDKLSKAFLARGVPKEFLLENGLAMERQGGGIYDRFRHRVMIPIADEKGRIVGFGGRVLDDAKPKYLNTKETVLFNKRRLLFGLDRSHQAIRQAGYAIIVEGYMDAISVFDAGVKNVVASLGTSFTAEHCKKLLRYCKRFYFCYDSDDAGQNATIRALSIVRDSGADVRVIVVPDGKDPDEFIRKHGADAFRALLDGAFSIPDYRLRYVLAHTSIDTTDGKMQALRAMLPVIVALHGAAERGELIKKLGATLLIDEGIIREEAAKAARNPRLFQEEHGTIGPRDHQRQAQVQASEAAQRQPMRRADSALQKAGRIVIRAVWADATLLSHVTSMVPLDELQDEVQRKILCYLRDQQAAGKRWDAARAAEALGDEAAEELSRAIVENEDASENVVAYHDSVGLLRRTYLTARYERLSREAAEASTRGDVAAAAAKLKEITEIKKEMDD
ncbi:MAG: DNA primase [Selenomonadaceae bacterium]|nr:DNA primase [Selenomonadaceae bacterium]